jgi:Zn-dependent protease with chaperone function
MHLKQVRRQAPRAPGLAPVRAKGEAVKLARLVILPAVISQLILLPMLEARPAAAARPLPAPPAAMLSSYLRKSYLELFELSPKLRFTAAEIDAERSALERGQNSCVDRFKKRSDQYEKQLEQAQEELKKVTAKLSEEQRIGMHCKIENLRLLHSEADLLANHAIPTAYDNLRAKLNLIQNWPGDYRKIEQELAAGSYKTRRWGDVADIGFRQIAKGQEDDIKVGQQAIEQMKRQGLLPPAVDNKAIVDYVTAVAQRIAAHSDLHVPLHVAVLSSKEINAFALPGGYLFVERGLLEAADDESELAGVLAHEIAHDTARHANKLIKRATIASIFYQAAQIAALVLTGGVASIGMYYALQYGFFGLGLVLDLKLLGVSREYELQADQLGIQYAWNADYDPTGFIRFFDKIATKEGYVLGVSWFRTHPPFYQRMVDAEREIMFLPKKERLTVQTAAFEQMKKELAPVSAEAEKKSKEAPSLIAPLKGKCPPPATIYKPGQDIEALCAQ